MVHLTTCFQVCLFFLFPFWRRPESSSPPSAAQSRAVLIPGQRPTGWALGCAHRPRRRLRQSVNCSGKPSRGAQSRGARAVAGNTVETSTFRVCHGSVRSFQPLIRPVALMPTSYFFWLLSLKIFLQFISGPGTPLSQPEGAGERDMGSGHLH